MLTDLPCLLNQNVLSQDKSPILPGMNAPHVYVRAWMLCCLNLSKGTDNVGGQLCGDRERPYSGATSSGSLEEGAGKRCSECGTNQHSQCSNELSQLHKAKRCPANA